MIKTLYVRVVATFLAAVLFGLIAAFFITTTLFRGELTGQAEEEMMANSRVIAGIYSRLNAQVADDYMQSTCALISYRISLFDAGGLYKRYGAAKQAGADADADAVPDEIVRLVRSGVPHHFAPRAPERPVVGIPVQIGSETYAMFSELAGNKWGGIIRKVLLSALAFVLLAGSLFIFVAARYLVKPLQAMTAATRRMSKGDFNIDWKRDNRKDELGELARSFGEMARELKQMERMRQDFVSNVSHEIQSPLTSISGFSQILKRQGMSEEQRAHYLDIIQKESERMSRLSENLLELASLESEHHPFHPKTYALDEQLRQVIVACEPQWSAKAIQFELAMPCVKISADPDQLYQVWMNLIGNAIKFSPPNGTIAVTVKLTTDEIAVMIADEGIGISKADQAHIFERFFKADRSRNRTEGGSGLGLAIASKIVKLHGGTIGVRSEQGEGAEFKVTLPAI
ncbi:sensor histidine kinase [Paenibacillus piri]|uniref:Heme sensor protein HssS n=1 Tax=Paenibacillus piri TaxID=2547395 RepID=A0A4R5KCI3_9BACL|nr:HAMP domain-containing sensor histidine kinase [Paenibacillus piri]TDF92335.1 HAMP domain-containing histidine kinase [Paenibacillus piri]